MRRRRQILVHGQGRSGAREPGRHAPLTRAGHGSSFGIPRPTETHPYPPAPEPSRSRFPTGSGARTYPQVAATISPDLAKAAVTVRLEDAQLMPRPQGSTTPMSRSRLAPRDPGRQRPTTSLATSPRPGRSGRGERSCTTSAGLGMAATPRRRRPGPSGSQGRSWLAVRTDADPGMRRPPRSAHAPGTSRR